MQEIDRSYRRSIHRVLENHVPQSVIAERNKAKSWKRGYNEEYDMVVISKDGTIGQILAIEELAIALPATPKNIRFSDAKRNHQKWARYRVPEELMDFDKLYKDEANPEAKWREVERKHEKFINDDFERRIFGDWFMNDGEPTYITGNYYFFLQHYLLTDMRRYGDFRMPQRDYFIFMEATFADNRSLGSDLLKSRRSSFSVGAGCTVLNISTMSFNGFFPIMSKKDKDAATLFENHIVKPFLNLPKHIQPQRTGEVMPKKELFFSSPKRKLTTNNKANLSDDGLNTLITFYATTPDAYDGTQVTVSINDEHRKYKGGIDINSSWNQAHKMCHIVGSKVVGKALFGSTASPPHLGGKNGEKFYYDSKISTRDNTGSTRTGLYAIFIPADYSTMGFFDEFGWAVYEDPAQPIKNELGEIIKIGAKRFLDEKEVSCGSDIRKLNEQKRNNPRVEADAFLDEDATNMYATTGMVNHINFLKEYIHTPKYKAQVFRFDLYYKPTDDNPLNVEISHNENGRFMASWLPPKELRNRFRMKDGRRIPLNSHLGALGADPYQADRTKYGGGSKMGLVGVTTKSFDLLEKDRNKTFVFYNYRGTTVEEAEDDVMKLILYLSMPILPETNKDSLVKRLYKEKLRGYVLANPLKKKSELSPDGLKYGGITTSINNRPKQEQTLESYIFENVQETVDENNIKVPFLELNVMATEYTDQTRTKLDGVVAWQLATIAVSDVKIKEEVKPTAYEYKENIINLFKRNNAIA